jgi:hypothetical protein
MNNNCAFLLGDHAMQSVRYTVCTVCNVQKVILWFTLTAYKDYICEVTLAKMQGII